MTNRRATVKRAAAFPNFSVKYFYWIIFEKSVIELLKMIRCKNPNIPAQLKEGLPKTDEAL